MFFTPNDPTSVVSQNSVILSVALKGGLQVRKSSSLCSLPIRSLLLRNRLPTNSSLLPRGHTAIRFVLIPQALRDTTLKPPYPKEAPLDNVFKFFRLLPKSHVHDKPKQPSTAKMPPASASVAISKRGGDVNAAGTPPGRFILSKGGGGGAVILGDGWGRQSRPPDSSAKTAFPADARSVLQRMEVLTETSGKGTGEGCRLVDIVRHGYRNVSKGNCFESGVPCGGMDAQCSSFQLYDRAGKVYPAIHGPR